VSDFHFLATWLSGRIPRINSMTQRLPKLQLPSGDGTKQILFDASKLAETGDLKGAQGKLKEALSNGSIPPGLHRQIMTWWAAGCFDLSSPSEKGTGTPRKSIRKRTKKSKR